MVLASISHAHGVQAGSNMHMTDTGFTTSTRSRGWTTLNSSFPVLFTRLPCEVQYSLCRLLMLFPVNCMFCEMWHGSQRVRVPQYLRFLFPNSIRDFVSGIENMKYWVLGLSGIFELLEEHCAKLKNRSCSADSPWSQTLATTKEPLHTR